MNKTKQRIFVCLVCFLAVAFCCMQQRAGAEADLAAGELVNASFEDALAGWTLSGDSAAACTTTESHSGEAALLCQAEQPYVTQISQTISGVAPGYYSLTACARSSGGQATAYLYANGTAQSACMTSIPATNALNVDEDGWNLITVRGIEVGEDGILTVGFYTDAEAGDYVVLDDLALVSEAEAAKPYLLGGDISQLTYVEDCGAVFYDADGNPIDALQALAENGWNFARLRLYNDPGSGHGNGTYYCHEDYMNPEDILSLARRAREKGMAIELTFHYSDYWTNSGTQIIPAQWQTEIEGLDDAAAVDKLEELIYNFTKEFMEQMKEQGTLPEYVSLGNETGSGMLFPYGKTSVDCWPNLVRFYNAGYRAVKEVSPDTQVIVHLDGCGDEEKYQIYFDAMEEYGGNYDVIGTSYYPYYLKQSVSDAVEFMNYLVDRYDCDVMIMETGYNWNPTKPDGYAGQLADNGCYEGIYESSPEGQKAFLIDLMSAMRNVDGGGCIGALYWDPIFVEQEGVGWAFFEEWGTVDGNVVSNTTLFDFEHKVLPAQEAYRYNGNGVQYACLSGKVVGNDDGTPLADTAVSVTFGDTVYQTVTDSCGGFFLHVSALQDASVSVEAEGVYTESEAQTITTGLGTLYKCSFVIDGGTIAGAVRDGDGNGVPNAQVAVSGEKYSYSAVTDADGCYTAPDLPEGTYTITVSAEGYEIPEDTLVREVQAGELQADCDFAAVLISGTATGYVYDANGNPLSGVSISVWKDIPNGDENTDYGQRYGTTDENGYYEIPFVTGGVRYKLGAYFYTYDSVEVDLLLDAGETKELDAITLTQTLGSITGTVVDADGNVVSDAQVEAVADDGLTYTAATDSSGAFTLDEIVAGNYQVRVTKSGLMSGSVSGVTVELSQCTDVGEVIMPCFVSVKNASFEDPSPTGEMGDMEYWDVECTVNGENTACFRQNRIRYGGTPDGTYALSFWLDLAFTADCHQTLTEMEPGHYVFSAMVYSGMTATFQMYVKDADGNILAQMDVPQSSQFIAQTLKFDLTGTEFTIGFYTDAPGGDWAVIDAVELGRYLNQTIENSTQIFENFPIYSSASILAVGIFLAMTGSLFLKKRVFRKLAGSCAVLAAVAGLVLYGIIYTQKGIMLVEDDTASRLDALQVAVRTLRATVAMFGGGADYDSFKNSGLEYYAWLRFAFWLTHLLAMYAFVSTVILTLGKLFLRILRHIGLRLFSRRILLVYGDGESAIQFVSSAVNARSKSKSWRKRLRRRATHRIVFVGEGTYADRMEQLGSAILPQETFDGRESCEEWLDDVHMAAPNRNLTIVCFDYIEGKPVPFVLNMLAAIEARGIPAKRVRFIVQCTDEFDYTFLQDARDAAGNRYATHIFSPAERMARLVVRKAPPYKTLLFAMGRALGDYNAVIVGFGEMGQKLLLQLVTNGQFVGSHFSVLVLDPDVDRVAGVFLHTYKEMLEKYNIRFTAAKSSSTQFVNQLIPMLPKLRTIALCTGNEHRNHMEAYNLRALLRANAAKLPKNGEIYMMQCYANISYLWDRNALLGGTTQQTVEAMTVTLGDNHDLLQDGIDDTARAVNGCYIGGHSPEELKRSWYALDHFSRESSRASADFIPAMLAAVNTNEAQVQALCGEEPEKFAERWTEALGAEQLETLAQLEHLRWVAFHYANGVRPMTAEEMTLRAHSGRKPIQKEIPHFGLGGRHACMVPWEKLDEGVALYNKLQKELDPAAKEVDWKQYDRNNVLNIPMILYIQREAEKGE